MADEVIVDPDTLLNLATTADQAARSLEQDIAEVGNILATVDRRGWNAGAMDGPWASARSGTLTLASDIYGLARSLRQQAADWQAFDARTSPDLSGPGDLAAGIVGAPITEAAFDVLVDGVAQSAPQYVQVAPATVDEVSPEAAAAGPTVNGGLASESGPFDGIAQLGANFVNSAQAAVTEKQDEVKNAMNGVGEWKDGVVAAFPLPFQAAGVVSDAAARAASEPGSIANCDQAEFMATQAAETYFRNMTPENLAAWQKAQEALVLACATQPVAQTSVETPWGPVMGAPTLLNKGAWDAAHNGNDALGGDHQEPPGSLSQSDAAAVDVGGGDLGVVGVSVSGASDTAAADGAAISKSAAHWDQMIAQAAQESPARADEVRYQRYTEAKVAEGKPAIDQSAWQVKVDQLRTNQASGRISEDAALLDANVPNNNYGKVALIPDGQGSYIRPDGMTDSAIIDVKSTDQPVVYYTEQLKLERQVADDGALDGQPRRLAVVVVTDDAANVRPSEPLARNAVVVHWNSETGQWSQWTVDSKTRTGSWQDVPRDQVRTMLGSGDPAPATAPELTMAR